MITAPAREERAERPTWTTEQAQAFLAVSRQHCIYGSIFRISLATGVRRGELLGLRWADIAWQAQLLRVRQSVGPIHTSMTPGSPKSSSSNRDVTVADALLADIKDHRARQNEQRLKIGPAWHDLDLVFCSEVGTAIQASNLYHEYRRLEALARGPHIAIHDQRHTVASWAAATGSDPKVLLGLYTHRGTAQRQRAAQT